MATLLIASTRPGAGKTAFAAWLATRLLRDGASVGLTKAVSPGDDPDADIFKALVPDAITADPSSPDSGPDAVAKAIGALKSDVNIVEGVASDSEANRQLADALDARVVLVAALDDDIVEEAQPFGDRLTGVVVNNLPRYREHQLANEVAPALEAAGVRLLGAVPEDRRLVAVTMRAISEHLGGRFSQWEDHGDRLVDYFLIGGNILDWGVHYFSSRENAAVLVRGDRPDIQMAALATPIKGLILTEGVDPLEYVYYEADQEEVPVVVVEAGTHDAAEALETLQEQSRFDHPDKLKRFAELADEQIDFEALREAIEQPVTG